MHTILNKLPSGQNTTHVILSAGLKFLEQLPQMWEQGQTTFTNPAICIPVINFSDELDGCKN